MSESLYARDGDQYIPSPFVRGPWSFDHCHAGPPAGLMATIIAEESPDLRMTRFTADIPGPIPLAPVRVVTSDIRRGRRIALVEASMSTRDGTMVMRAAAWMIRVDRDVVEATQTDREPLPPPESCTVFRLDIWGEEPDFTEAIELRAAEGEPFSGNGPAAMWARVHKPLIAGKPWNHYARAVATADFPNGVAAIEPMDRLIAVNTDVTVYFGREPVGQWIGIRSQTNSSGLGLGMTDSLLYDTSGFLGTANQSIYFGRPSPPGTA